MKRVSLMLGAVLSLAGTALAEKSGGDTAGYAQIVKPFFEEHCVSCHGEKKKKGDLRVDTLSMNFDSPGILGHWKEIMDRINSGDMPPEDEKRPKAGDLSKVTDWITAQLTEAEIALQSSASERVSFRRLSREEYANTVRDLLGVTFDVMDPSGLPDDPDWHGFQRIGSVLTISPSHVEKYLSAAETVLSEALCLDKRPATELVKWGPFDIRHEAWSKFQKEYEARGIADKVRVDVMPNNGALDSHDLVIKTAGDYLVKVKLSGLRPVGGRAPRLRLYVPSLGRILFDQDIEAPENSPLTVEVRVHLPAGRHRVQTMNVTPGPHPDSARARSTGAPRAFTGLNARVPWQMKLTDDYGNVIEPVLLVDSIEWSGPVIDGWPTAAYQRIFFGGDKVVKDLSYAREIISRFAERAWRRPLQAEELNRLVQVFEQAQKLDDNFEVSVRASLLTAMCSKDFLYLQEGNVTTPTQNLTDWELASRLSYFFWSSMPDQQLISLAREGRLHEPGTLRAEVRRMTRDPKAATFAESFSREWLQLKRVGMFAPDGKLYPEYDDNLEKSMIKETTGYVQEVFEKNLSLREFLQSDWTMLNERLAKHYEIPGVKGDRLHRVSLSPEAHRGGILTQGAILSMTSDGTRHRPVHRGVWLLESIIGRPAPPPPANVPPIEPPPTSAPKTTLRAKLEAHKQDVNCAACHLKIDPLGIAFENYDAIGRWRTEEVQNAGVGENPKLDPSGELNDGRKFADADGLKKILVSDLDKFTSACTEKLATYAMRRAPNFGDRFELKAIAEGAKASGYSFQTLVEELACSPLFQKR
ncbi:MAG: DUF1592 domain-containing protein [Verrucomicrobiota bacterium]